MPAAPISSKPKVSFLALCFNHEPYVLECLRSIEAQAWPNAELVILDNASGDRSADVIREWAACSSLNPTLILQQEAKGICANMNTLVGYASGEYLAWIATDDYWLPQKTSQQVAALERLGSDFAVAYADANQVDAAGDALDPSSFIQAHREFTALPAGDVLRDLLRGPFIPGMSTMVRGSALEAIGPFDESLVYEDYDAWLRLAERWQFHADPEPLCAYRILNSSMIRTVAAQDKPEKVLSDARIMAKVAVMPRLDDTARKNTRRRVLRLAIQLLEHPGDWSDTLLDLQTLTRLDSLFLLAAAHRDRGTLSTQTCQDLIVGAANRGLLQPEEKKALPKAFSEQLQKVKTAANSDGSGTAEFWENVYKALR